MKIIQGSVRSWLLTISVLLSYPVTIFAEVINTFQLTGWEGEVSLRSFSDEQKNTNAGAVQDLDTRDITELEINLRTHSYVYHPKFLRIDAGGGPVFIKNHLKDLTGENTVNETLFNFNAHLNFLEGKPYPFSLYFDRQNPLVAPSINEHLLQENTKFGAKMSLRKPLTPVLIEAEAFKLTTKGDGFNLVIDDEIDEFKVRFYKNEKRGGYNQLLFQSNNHISRSGSKSLAITPNNVTTNSMNYDSRYIFGADDKFLLRNIFSYVDQDSTPSLKQIKFTPDFRWNHSKTLYSFYQYDFLKNEQQGINTTNNSASAGYSYQKINGISSTGNAHMRRNATTGFSLDSYGMQGSADYSRKFAIGTLKLHAGLGFDDYSRKTTSGTGRVQVFDEGLVLTGVGSVDLKREFIDALTIIVSNANRTQTFILNTDYRIIVIGDKTQIQRLLGGNIQDGEDLLVDYEYLTGGTFTHTSLDQQYQANYLVSKYMNIFAGVSKKDVNLTGGAATISLTSSTDRFYGVTSDYPAFEMLTVGAEIRLENHEEEIAPFKRVSKSAYMQFNLMRSTSLRLTGQKVSIDHQSSLEDVDLTRYSLRLRSRPFVKTVVTLSAVDEKDVGGTIPRTVRDIVLKGEWNYRKLFLSLYGRHNRETQGSFIRERNIIRATLERRFY